MALIDRQAAIDAVEESRRLNHHRDGKEACAHEYEHRHFLKILMELPSAGPEIIRCKDCKFWTHIKRTKRHWCKTDDGLYDLNTSADDFCSYAERRTDEPDR